MKKLFLIGILISATIGGAIGIFYAHRETIARPVTNAIIPNLPSLEFFNNSFSEKSAADQKNFGAIVNHHLLGASLIADTLQNTATDASRTVVLISPNHFDRGAANILTATSTWQTPYGNLDAADTLALPTDPTTLQQEHGIFNVLPFIKKINPHAKIFPLIIKDKTPTAEIKKLAEQLAELPSDTLFIGSFDFSHELVPIAARLHNQTALAAIANFDLAATARLDIDSRPGLALLLQVMQERGATWQLVKNTNSAELLQKPDITDTVSYIDGIFPAEKIAATNTTTLLFLGDMMLDRSVRRWIEKSSAEKIFSNLPRLFSGQDLTVVNAEGSFTTFKPDTNPHTFSFTFRPELLDTLKKLGFNYFGLANNHALNFGAAGLAQSKKFITAANLNYFGDPQNQTEFSTIAEIRGQKIALIGYQGLDATGYESTLAEIKKLRPRVDKIIVLPHWGTEYELKFTAPQQKLGHAFIDAGADLVIGTHPHVIEPLEIYHGKVIFYSLGNFVFDQNFSADTQQGLGVGIAFGPQQTIFYLLPLQQKNIALAWPDALTRDKLLSRIADNSAVSPEIKKQILTGEFFLP